jgi:cold shock CspA family protein/ribosome-associated translation inhibitor RaiA
MLAERKESNMQTPPQISVRNVEDSDAARALVQQCVEKLEVFYGRIISCRVMIEVPQRFPAGSPVVYNVRVDIRVPGEEIVIRRQANPELHTAIQNAFDAAGRRLQDYARRIRGDIKQSATMSRGTVTQLFPFEGYGFLTTDDGREVYFHRHSVLDAAFERLEVGSVVRFVEEVGVKGPQASTVTLAGASH